jgi:hypothetical protein
VTRWLNIFSFVFNSKHVIVMTMQVPSSGLKGLWINADVRWKGELVTGGCDEGCAAYVMIELQDATTGTVIPGYERGRCTMMNLDSLGIPITWEGSPKEPATGAMVRLRFFFRDATIYALGGTH